MVDFRQYLDVIDGKVILTEETREKLRDVELMNMKIYDAALLPGFEADLMASNIFSDITNSCSDHCSSLSEVIKALSGDVSVEGFAGNIVKLRFSMMPSFPWKASKVSEIHMVLTHGIFGYDSGSFRSGIYSPSEVHPAETYVKSIGYIDQYVESALHIVNYSAMHPVVSAILFYGVMCAVQPFDGDNRLTYRELFKMVMYNRGYRGIYLCKLDSVLEERHDLLESANGRSVELQDPTEFVNIMLECLMEAYHDAYAYIMPHDVKKRVDGISRSLLRHSRYEGYFVITDAQRWLGDISKQTFYVRINNLISLGVLKKDGNTRSTRYVYVDPFGEVRRIYGGKQPHLDEDKLQEFYIGIGSIPRH